MSTKRDAVRPLVWGLFSWWRYRTRTARPRRRRGNKHPSGVFVSARFPMRRNVYQERCRQTFWSGAFLLRHPLTHVGAGRYRTRTARAERSEGNQSHSATTTTAACGRNREELLGPRSDFSKPCQGAAEKSANATRTGASRQIPSRFPTRRNVYQERCRPTHSSRVFLFWWTVQDENRDKQRQGITMRAISCLLIFLTRRGILGSVQQIGICEGALWTNI